MAISQIPVKFIFHSYSESSTFGRPGHGRSIPHQMAISQIPALTAHISWQLIFHSYSESSTFGRPGLGRSNPPSNGDFTDSCSTLKAHIWQTPCQMVISQIPVKFIFHSYSESSTFGRPGHGRSIPHQMAISQIPALTAHISWQLIFHSYSESSTFGRPGLGRSTPIWVVISLIPALTAHISWQLIFHSYSESSTFGRPGHGRSTPHHMAISQIAALTAHISFVLWELNIWQTKSLQIYPPVKWQFYRFLWNSYFISALRAQHLADQV